MNAIVYHRYGPPDVLVYQAVPKPVPSANEVLVKVHAASINSWDWDMIRGKPWIVRMWGLLRPKFTIPGGDFSGTIERVGKNITKFKTGDAVFGDLADYKWGSFAEYVCAPEHAITIKPKTITHEEAASLPQAGALAFQSLVDWGKVTKGMHVLINGAGGGVGTLAIQLAKYAGAEVTAVDSLDKHDLLVRLGADHVINFATEDFTAHENQYDIIMDVVANRTLSRYKHALREGGIFLMIGGTMRAIFSVMLFGRLISTRNKKLQMMPYKANKDMHYLAQLVEQRIMIPTIESRFSLHETADAFRKYSSGKTRGKVIITLPV